MKTTPPLGPAPSRPLEPGPPTLDPARARVLRAVLAVPEGEGATVTGLTERLGGHPNTVRHHLSALTVDGLLETVPASPSGPGRPAALYRPTPAGAAALGPGADVVDEYVALAGAFADRLAAHGGDPGGDARTVGRAWGTALSGRGAREASEPRARVVGLLERLGFSPRPARRDPSGPGAVLLRTCPLLDAARRHPEVVCEVHRGLVEGVLGGAGVEGAVDLRPFERPGACLLVLPTSRKA